MRRQARPTHGRRTRPKCHTVGEIAWHQPETHTKRADSRKQASYVETWAQQMVCLKIWQWEVGSSTSPSAEMTLPHAFSL